MRRLVGALVLCLLASPAAAATYFVNNQAGSGCSDAGTGQTQGQPFCTFTPINAISAGATFPAGTTILLARGATWNQELVLRGNGSSLTVMNTVTAYGTASLGRPKIIRNQGIDDRGIRMIDPRYWEV